MKLKTLENKQKKDIKRLLLQIVVVGVVALCAGGVFKSFFEPASIIPTGLSGLSLIIRTGIQKLGFDIPTAIIYLALNLIIFAFAFKIMGWRFLLLTAVGMGSYTLGMQFLSIPQIAGVAEIDILLYAVVGAILSGLCVGVAMKFGGSTGGSDVVGVIINRYFPKIKTGYCLLIINAIVILLSFIVEGLQTGLYAVVIAVINALTTNLVLDGSKRIVAFYIICDKYEEIAEAILQKYHRGVTKLDAIGVFSKKDKAVLLCLVPNDNAREMHKLVKSIDDNAFVFSAPVTETMGDGNFMKQMSIFKNKLRKAKPNLKMGKRFNRHQHIKKIKLKRKSKRFKLLNQKEP